MYEYLLENLVNGNQVRINLRITADRKLISKLYKRQMNALALKYFGVDSNNNFTENKEDIVAYCCPYSGIVTTDPSTIELEHIIPKTIGGTVLFNCIPALNGINQSKNDRHLLEWWENKPDYFKFERLERLIQYMLEAYTLTFEEPKEEELYDNDSSFEEDDDNDIIYEQNDDLTKDKKDKIIKEYSLNKISYYEFINQLINRLAEDKDVTEYKNQLEELKNKKVFGDIEDIEKLTGEIQTIIKGLIGDDTKRYLTYSMNIDTNRLFKSLKTQNQIEEIRKRFENIRDILINEKIGIKDYFENLQDIDEINLIYFDKITEDMKKNFIENIRIGYNTKINIIIEMLRRTKNENEIEAILAAGSTKHFTTYIQNEEGEWEDKTYGEIKNFWNSHKDELLPKIEALAKEDPNFRENLNKYYFYTVSGQKSAEGNKKRQDTIIEMLRRTKNENEIEAILAAESTKHFTTYKQNDKGKWEIDKTYGEFGNFCQNSKELPAKIKELAKEDLNFRENLNKYYFTTFSGQNSTEGKKKRQDTIIEMLRRTKNENEIAAILASKSKKHFTTYKQNEEGEWEQDKEYSEIGYFCKDNRDLLLPQIEALAKEDPNFRENLNKYYFYTKGGQKSAEGKKIRLDIFIKMLCYSKKDEIADIFKQKTTKPFTIYKQNGKGEWEDDKKYGEIGQFWSSNSNKKIIPILFYSDEYSEEKYDIARERVLEYLSIQRIKKNEPGFKNIEEYINSLDTTKKETEELIKLRNSLNKKKDKLQKENEELLEELNELNSSNRRAM